MTPTTMHIIAGQNVKANSKPAPTGFGFGSGHNPTAAAKMMVRSGAAPMTSKTSPTLTHVDLRYSRMNKCGLTVKLRGRQEAPDKRRGRTLSSGARGAQPLTHHGPLQRLLEVAPMVNGVDVIPTTPTVLRDPQGESGCKRNTARWAFDRAKCKAPRHQEPRHSQHNQQASDHHPDDYQS